MQSVGLSEFKTEKIMNKDKKTVAGQPIHSTCDLYSSVKETEKQAVFFVCLFFLNRDFPRHDPGVFTLRGSPCLQTQVQSWWPPQVRRHSSYQRSGVRGLVSALHNPLSRWSKVCGVGRWKQDPHTKKHLVLRRGRQEEGRWWSPHQVETESFSKFLSLLWRWILLKVFPKGFKYIISLWIRTL